MATETEKLYTEQTQTAPGTTETATAPATATDATATAATGTATSPYSPAGTPLSSHNASMVDQINKMYDAQRDSTVGRLEAAQNKAVSDAQAAYDKITPGYQAGRNDSAAAYERQRRNNNIQAAANGINTGAGSQMQLASSNVYQSNLANLHKAEQEALQEADRNMVNLKQQYQADINSALSDNDAQRAAALLNEYGQEYDRLADEAKTAAAYGDFSGYISLFGAEVAANMERTWMLQNPDLAFTLGKIDRNEYFNMTGKWPHETGGGGGGGSSSGGGSGYSYYGGSGSGGGGGGNSTVSAQNVYDALKAGYSPSSVANAVAEATNNSKEAAQMYANVNGQYQQQQQQQIKNAANQQIQQQANVARAKTAQATANTGSSSKSTSNKGSTLTTNYVNNGKVRSGIL